MPTTLPSNKPAKIATAIRSCGRCASTAPVRGTPAANRANSGTQKPAENGCRRCSNRLAGAAVSPRAVSSSVLRTLVSSPSATPAKVA